MRSSAYEADEMTTSPLRSVPPPDKLEEEVSMKIESTPLIKKDRGDQRIYMRSI